MGGGDVHYELFARRVAGGPWSLQFATEDRLQAVVAAEAMLAERRAAAVRVTKEILDPASGGYSSLAILTRGDLSPPRPKSHLQEEEVALLCVAPTDLYSLHARERIGRLLSPG